MDARKPGSIPALTWWRRILKGLRTDKKRFGSRRVAFVEELENRVTPALTFSEFVDPHPAPGNQFGATVAPLSTGNVVIASPYDDAGGGDASLGAAGR